MFSPSATPLSQPDAAFLPTSAPVADLVASPAPAPVQLTHAGPPYQPAPFALQTVPQITLDWDDQVFTIARPNEGDLMVSTEEMISCVLASLAMSRRWKMEQGAPTRYNEIARSLMIYIPATSTANFSIIHNGELWKSAQPVTYNCIFSGAQITELTQSGAITGNIYNDVKWAYPKPLRTSRSADQDSGLLADFFAVHSTKSDQKVLLNGIFAAAKDAERNVAWRAKRTRTPKSLRGTERYSETAPSIVNVRNFLKFREGVCNTHTFDLDNSPDHFSLRTAHNSQPGLYDLLLRTAANGSRVTWHNLRRVTLSPLSYRDTNTVDLAFGGGELASSLQIDTPHNLDLFIEKKNFSCKGSARLSSRTISGFKFKLLGKRPLDLLLPLYQNNSRIPEQPVDSRRRIFPELKSINKGDLAWEDPSEGSNLQGRPDPYFIRRGVAAEESDIDSGWRVADDGGSDTIRHAH
ncbi:hypothetical protein F5890DRAFT_1471800 [Lentinula detonsa]|uniref:Uncharacterized protein n=1 Tax=Lentinula detonsa TaxID=2804962 RepID=A0AA38UVC4_9AGAR|nr:hypothetical protein F5890DRAFT_1471800 [Lentinula detonsa]